ncbi:4HBT domain-containing protein [Mycena kentingensis (nom. inval.)]|nr:4HBT domain-containing protein [Mycena kentingensis (nom. inval.)]
MERTIASITGNADDETKRAFLVIGDTFARRPSGKPSFGESILHRLRVVHASVDPKLEEPLKKEGKIVVEVEMADDMLNGGMI